MALSMEEERMLAEIALQLRRDDPALAERLTMFRRRPRRGLRAMATMAVAAVMVIALMATTFLTVLPI